jgi:hypothetical protein
MSPMARNSLRNSMKLYRLRLVARDGIEPPTPAFSWLATLKVIFLETSGLSPFLTTKNGFQLQPIATIGSFRIARNDDCRRLGQHGSPLAAQEVSAVTSWYDGCGKTLVMQNVSVHKASDLPQEVKSAVEQLLGRTVGADEEVSIAAVPPQQIPPSRSRRALAQELEVFLDRRAEKVRDVSDVEIDAVVDEAVDHARHRRG